MTVDLSAALVEGVGQFAGAFTNPLVGLIVVGLTWFVRRTLFLRLAGAVLGMAVAAPNAWTADAWAAGSAGGAWVVASAIVLGGVLGVLLQIEFMLGVVLPILALARRLLDAVMGLFRAPNVPPSP